jgi:PD-(D/E)XK nuclease superfamily
MTIKLDLWKSEDYARIDIDGVRHYDIDGNFYPSVTQVTSYYGKYNLDKWKRRVGQKEADRICDIASANGTYIHELCEQYLLGNGVDHTKSTKLQKMIFTKFIPILNNISVVHLLESKLFSHKLKLAGTVDCVGYYNGVLSVIDFKTAKKEKPPEWIQGYFVQTIIYALMIYEIYNVKIKQIVILFACSDLSTNVVIKPITRDLLNLVKTYITHYRNANKDSNQ